MVLPPRSKERVGVGCLTNACRKEELATLEQYTVIIVYRSSQPINQRKGSLTITGIGNNGCNMVVEYNLANLQNTKDEYLYELRFKFECTGELMIGKASFVWIVLNIEGEELVSKIVLDPTILPLKRASLLTYIQYGGNGVRVFKSRRVYRAIVFEKMLGCGRYFVNSLMVEYNEDSHTSMTTTLDTIEVVLLLRSGEFMRLEKEK